MMKSDFNSSIKQITNDLCNAEELMKNGKLDDAFKLSEKIAVSLNKIKGSVEQKQNLESLQTSFAKFRRNLNNQMVKVLKSGLNQVNPEASKNR